VHPEREVTEMSEETKQPAPVTRRVAFATIGCRLNQAETDAAKDEFAARGWQIVEFGKSADVYMVNTCTVTGGADRSSRQLLHRARRSSPEATIIAAGCFAASHAEELVHSGDVDLVLGVEEKNNPFDFLPLNGRPEEPLVFVNTETTETRASVGTRVSGRSRAFLKVQDGCDHNCTYCAVTLVRGPSRSASLEDIRSALKRIIAAGFEEVVLTGVDLSAWGSKNMPSQGDFVDLVELAVEMGLPRVRISSMEPWELKPERISRLAAIDPWCEHLHISLQSADSEMLVQMNRPTDLGILRESIAELLLKRPKATVGADMIVGFPGESEDAFNSSLRFLDDGPLHYLHVFPFSPRPGTAAHDLPGQLEKEIIQERARQLRSSSKIHRRNRLKQMVGLRDEILIEEDGRSGYTRPYLRAKIENGTFKPRSRVSVELVSVDDKDDLLYARTIQ